MRRMIIVTACGVAVASLGLIAPAEERAGSDAMGSSSARTVAHGIGEQAASGHIGTRASEPPAALGDPPLVPGGATCASSGCHAEMTQHQRVHQPVADNKCDACHEPKEGATPFQPGAKHEFKRAGDNPELCYACHDRLGQDDFVHEPVKMGVCVLCHDPHGADAPALLRVDTDRQLCAQCHRITFDQGNYVHSPVGTGQCMACHNPHGSDHKRFLKAAPPELCLDCHADIEELLYGADVTHDALTTGRACLSCHDPHVSDIERLLVGEPMGLCLSCHDEELESDEGAIRNMAKDLKDHPNHHGPILDKNCQACHNPHGGTIFRLLTEEYPQGLYAPFDEDRYALCFGCHELEMVLEERLEEVTEFRNGDLNLHYVHVNREDKGTTCGACHDVHAGKGPKHIAEGGSARLNFATPGDQPILIKYEATSTGGSCQTACHSPWAYDRVNPSRRE